MTFQETRQCLKPLSSEHSKWKQGIANILSNELRHCFLLDNCHCRLQNE